MIMHILWGVVYKYFCVLVSFQLMWYEPCVWGKHANKTKLEKQPLKPILCAEELSFDFSP